MLKFKPKDFYKCLQNANLELFPKCSRRGICGDVFIFKTQQKGCLEISLHLGWLETANSKLFLEGSSFLSSGFKMKLMFAVNEAMVSVTFCSGHHIGMQDIFQVTLEHKNIINEVPMFGLRMHSSYFQTIFLLEKHLFKQGCNNRQPSSDIWFQVFLSKTNNFQIYLTYRWD